MQCGPVPSASERINEGTGQIIDAAEIIQRRPIGDVHHFGRTPTSETGLQDGAHTFGKV
jgi:hypothetical protein